MRTNERHPKRILIIDDDIDLLMLLERGLVKEGYRVEAAASLPEGEEVISLITLDADGMVLTASENGYGKLTPVDDFPLHGRGGQGVIALQISDRNGRMVGAMQIKQDDEVMLISSNGTLVRTPVRDISVQGRNTQGVRLIRLDEGDRLVGLECIIAEGVEGADGIEGVGEAEAGSDAEDTPAE